MSVLLAAAAFCARADEEGGSGNSKLEEVTVTARRTNESIQSVPVSVAAITADTLRERAIRTPTDIQFSVPGVRLSTSNEDNTRLEIRGQTKALAGPSQPAVLTYFAEVPSQPYGDYVPLLDLASVQVLKGPQGTLFGRNTTGGAILYEPALPTAKYEGYIQAGYGNYNDREVQGVLNLPLSEVFQLRFAGDLHRRLGYARNLGVGGPEADVNSGQGRVVAELKPLENLKNLTIVDYYHGHSNSDEAHLGLVAPGSTLLSLLGIQQAAFASLAELRPFQVKTYTPLEENNLRYGVTNRTEWGVGSTTLVNIFGYRTTKVHYTTDSGIPELLTDGTGAFIPFAGVPVDFIFGDLTQDFRQYSDELQLRGKSIGNKLDWLVGAFYLKSEPSGSQGQLVAFAHVPGTPLPDATYNFLTETSKAVYAHGRYDLDFITQGLQAEIGIRYTRDSISSCTGNGLTGSTQDTDAAECFPGSTRMTNASVNGAASDATTWSAGLNWQIDPDLFAYVVSRHGYRAGGVNGPAFSGRLTPFQTFAPETVTDVETGIRSDWRLSDDVRLRFNASGFIGYYSNVQVALTGIQTASAGCNAQTASNPTISPDGDCNPANDPSGGTLIVNLGKTKVPGIDLDGALKVHALTLSYAASLLWPQTRSIDVPAALAPYSTGDRIPFNETSRLTLTAGARYDLLLPGNAGSVAFDADYYHTNPVFYVNQYLPAYDLVNASINYNDIAARPVDLTLYAHNLFNRIYLLDANAAGPTLGLGTYAYGPPRMYGLQLRYRFGG
jgi:iron complex outermembrane receptor protein